ncbi:MAG: YHYH protein [Pseudomonadales bacterium]|nr:YHYH protein [Pseudomonadales bacterium]
MTIARHSLLSVIAVCAAISSSAHASAVFEDNTLSIPYVQFGDNLYQVELILSQDGDTIEFVLGPASEHETGTEAPANAALFAGNVLTIPSVRVGTESYRVQLDYFESEAVFRLIETAEQIFASTDNVLCDYNDSTPNSQDSLTITSTSSWTCSDGERQLNANGIPDHEVGQFPNSGNPSEISEQTVSASMTLEPMETGTVTELGGPAGVIGYVLNGVKIDASTGGTCDDSGENCSLNGNVGSWNLEALNQTSFDFGTDENNAHVQPTGAYHYHGMPEGFIAKRGGNSSTMTLIAWAADGFPIYARYGYSDPNNANSEIRAMTSSYQFVTEVSDSRPSVEVYPLGTFRQDYEYVAGSGDLDECNGRFGVTPEFPNGIYHYFATDTFPFLQRCVTGAVDTSGSPMGPPPM